MCIFCDRLGLPSQTMLKKTVAAPRRTGRVQRGIEAVSWYVRFFRDQIGTMRDAHERFGRMMAIGDVIPGLRPRDKLAVFAFGPELNRTVLGDAEHFRTTGVCLRGPADSAQRRIRFGLPRMNGEKHRQQRALIMPTLQKKPVMGYAPTMVEITDEFRATEWQDGQKVDMWREMRKLAMRLTSRILFGFEDHQRAYALGAKLERWGATNFRPATWLFPFDVPGSMYRSLLRQAEAIERDILAMVAAKRDSGEGTDVLARLVRAHDDEHGQMTDMDLIGQVTILFGASYETTVNALTWTLFLLAQHPAVMHDVLDELDGKLGGGPPTFAQLPELTLLDAVIKESLRILPPLPYTIRAVMHGAQLGERELHDGDRVVCSSYMTHHMPDLFPDPERFDPSRWSRITPGQYEYWPFSAGPRTCVGYIFGMTEMMIALAMILPRWRVAMIPGTRVDRAVRLTMNPDGGLPMTVHRQDRKLAAAPVKGNIHEMVDLR